MSDELGRGIPLLEPSNKHYGHYVRVPLWWIKAANETGGKFAASVALMIWYRSSVTKTDTVTISNVLGRMFGVGRKQKASGLAALSNAGLVRVSQKQGCSPIVTLLKKEPPPFC